MFDFPVRLENRPRRSQVWDGVYEALTKCASCHSSIICLSGVSEGWKLENGRKVSEPKDLFL